MSYGSIFGQREVKEQLYNLNKDYRGRKTWADLYTNAGLAAEQQQSAVNYDYSNALSQAYLSSLNTNSAISGTNILQGNKQALLDQNALALQEAFNTYSKQHVQNTSAIREQLNKTTGAIDTALTEQADNTIAYANAHYDYLKKLYDDYYNQDNKIFDNILWKKYLVNETDEEGNVIDTRLKRWNELATPSRDENGEWTSLYNDKNELTLAGADFFDQMENFVASVDADRAAGALSWGEYLNEANPKLLKWANEANKYDYTIAGSNAGSFKTLFGMTSTDNKYEFAERYGGFSSGQLKGIFSKFIEHGDNYSKLTQKTGGGARNKRFAKDTEAMANDLKTLTDTLGITDDIESNTGVSINRLVDNITNNTSNMKSGWDLAGYFFGGVGSGVGTGFVSGGVVGAGVGQAVGTGLGAAIGSVVPGAGTAAGAVAGGAAGAPVGSAIGAAIGSVIGFIGGLVKGSVDTRKSIEANEQYEKDIEKAYLDMVGSLISYANNKPKDIN